MILVQDSIEQLYYDCERHEIDPAIAKKLITKLVEVRALKFSIDLFEMSFKSTDILAVNNKRNELDMFLDELDIVDDKYGDLISQAYDVYMISVAMKALLSMNKEKDKPMTEDEKQTLDKKWLEYNIQSSLFNIAYDEVIKHSHRADARIHKLYEHIQQSNTPCPIQYVNEQWLRKQIIDICTKNE